MTEDTKNCSKCGAKEPGTEQAFYFTLVMEDQDEEMTLFFGFNRVLDGIEVPETTEILDASLNNLCGKNTSINYNKQNNKYVISDMKIT